MLSSQLVREPGVRACMNCPGAVSLAGQTRTAARFHSIDRGAANGSQGRINRPLGLLMAADGQTRCRRIVIVERKQRSYIRHWWQTSVIGMFGVDRRGRRSDGQSAAAMATPSAGLMRRHRRNGP
jgi:hypothetical protein